jgi:hypothetical protein
MCVNNVSYEKLFIGNGFWVMSRQHQNMLWFYLQGSSTVVAIGISL